MTQKGFNGQERRAYMRLEASLSVRFKVSGGQMSKIYTATTRNISHGGLCMEVHRDKEELIHQLSGERPQLGIDLDTLIPDKEPAHSEKPLWVNSRVDWTRKPEAKDQALLMGIEFENLAREAREKIHDYLVDEFVKGYEQYH